MVRVILIVAAGALALVSGGGVAERLAAAAPQGIVAPPPAPPRAGPEPAAGRRIPVGTGTISGVVVSAQTGRPIRNARVQLNGAAGTPAPPGDTTTPPNPASTDTLPLTRMAVTDVLGRFAFSRLAAGAYTFAVSHENYLNGAYGQRRPGGPGSTLRLHDGQQLTITVPMTRGGVLSGQVYDEDGEPVRNAMVQAWRLDMSTGVRRLQPLSGVSSDDRGAYRVSGLQPGSYLVSATPRPGTVLPDALLAEVDAIEEAIASGRVQPGAGPGSPAFVMAPAPQRAGVPPITSGSLLPIYYPGTPEPAGATFVQVHGGDEHGPLDILIQRVQATRIQGTIASTLPQGVSVRVALQSADPMRGPQTVTSAVNQNGTFQFPTVAPGRYTLLAQTTGTVEERYGYLVVARQTMPDEGQRWFAREEVVVQGQPLVETVLALQPGRSLSGTVVFDMARPPDLTRTNMTVMLNPWAGAAAPPLVPGPAPQARVEPDGSFTMRGIAPGEYSLRTTGTVRSVTVNGQETMDVPLVVAGDRDVTGVVMTITDRETDLWGVVSGRDGTAAIGETIVVATTDERFWHPGSRRIVMSRTMPDGQYRVRNLPPGSYVVGVIEDFEPGRQFDPAVLAALRAGGRWVNLIEGSTVRQDLALRR